MTDQQSTRKTRPHQGRLARLVAGVALITVGLIALVDPFVADGPTWRWSLDSQDQVSQGTVNAEVTAIDARGVHLLRRGKRAISIISPPLQLSKTPHRELMISIRLPDDAAMSAQGLSEDSRVSPDVSSATPTMGRVRLLWQTAPAAEFRYREKQVQLTHDETRIRFSLSVPPPTLHRIGVQFPDADRIVVRALALERLGFSDRWKAFIEELLEPEPIENHSINFLRGPRMLGHGLNYYLVALVCSLSGGHVLAQLRRHRSAKGRPPGEATGTLKKALPGVAAIILAAWLLVDAQATYSLTTVARREAAAYRGKTWPEMIELMNGPQIAWAFHALNSHAPDGSTFAVVSDEPFTPYHRLAYLVGPRLERRAASADAAFVVVIESSRAEYDTTHRRFRVGQGVWFHAERIAAYSPHVYLLRKTSQ